VRRLPLIFWISLGLVVPFVLWGTLRPENLDTVTTGVQEWLVDQFGWFYLITASVILGFVIYLAFSRFGKIRLGRDDEEPEYSTRSWFAMLFSAGMGIGLVFWGVAEPLAHYTEPPVGQGGTDDAARDALTYSFFHWGLHPWAIYSLLALALAYTQFRKGSGGTISSIFRPVLGDRVDGPTGKVIDVLAIVATVFGVATSLGLGAQQINGGLGFLFEGIDVGTAVQLVIIAVVTVLFLISAMTGISRGIKYLSNLNLALATTLLLFVLFAGPTNSVVSAFTSTLGSYIAGLPSMSLQAAPFEADRQDWIGGWTIFYWAWWISWSPFVGTFIARVSRGRTIREFVAGVLAVPTLVGALWFAVFGGTGILAEGGGAGLAEQETETALFAMLETLPLSAITATIAIGLIVSFFITSADSATYVLSSLSLNGALSPPRPVSLVWGLVLASSAAVLLVAGGLEALQTASIIAAFPFTIVLIGAMFALISTLSHDPLVVKRREKAAPVLGYEQDARSPNGRQSGAHGAEEERAAPYGGEERTASQRVTTGSSGG
jgi:glycine betaine transporter